MDNRFYFEKENKQNDIVKIVGQEYNHLVKVRRATVGDKIVAFNGDGSDYNLEICEISKNYVSCKIESVITNSSVDKTNITIYLASIKSDALDEALDGLTQLNIKDIVIFSSQFTNVKYSDEKISKIKTHLIQSCKQCERADIPNVRLIKFEKMLDELKDYDLNIFAYENAKENFNDLAISDDKKMSIIIGGEGGFSEEEVERLDKLCCRVSLGKTILRAKVAVIALTSAVLSKLGKFSR